MQADTQSKIDIPESIDAYQVTLFWGLTISQVVLVFVATLFLGFGIFSVVAKKYFASLGMFLLAGISLLGMVEIRGRNFFRHVAFIVSYYRNKSRVLIYHHAIVSGLACERRKQLVFDKEDNSKTFIWISLGVVAGVVLLLLTAYYLGHVLHS
jgi:hypothetical protein